MIGILLKSLTPIFQALTPIIEPLARAFAPLIELLGAGLLIVVQLITPAIVLFAQGLEKVTTFIKNTVLAGFRFIVDALNKLPFIDIQIDLANTGDSFDAMSGQIATAGTMAGTASTAVSGFATATDAEKIAADKAKTATDLWAQAARENEAAAKPLTTVLGTLSDEMDETYTATDSLGIIIGKTVPQVSALTTQYIAENKAAAILTPTLGALSDEMDEAYTATDNLGVIIGASRGPAVDLANAIDQMTMDIENAQTAADLNKAAFAGLTPELMAAAIALGIFKGEVAGVGSAASAGGSGPGGTDSGDTPALGSGGNAGNPDGSSKGGLDAGEVERGLQNRPVGSWIRDRYSGGYWIKIREPRGNNDRTGTGYPRWARHVRTLPSATGSSGGDGSSTDRGGSPTGGAGGDGGNRSGFNPLDTDLGRLEILRGRFQRRLIGDHRKGKR